MDEETQDNIDEVEKNGELRQTAKTVLWELGKQAIAFLILWFMISINTKSVVVLGTFAAGCAIGVGLGIERIEHARRSKNPNCQVNFGLSRLTAAFLAVSIEVGLVVTAIEATLGLLIFLSILVLICVLPIFVSLILTRAPNGRHANKN